MTDIDQDAASKHTIPVIDRMMELLGHLEHHDQGLTIRQLTDISALPRTTIYRILNTLIGHDIVRRDIDGAYHLGRRLLSLAAHVTARFSEVDVAAIGQPFLDRLAADLGEGIKLSAMDQEGVLVLATSQGRREYALTVTPGQRMPINAGAASKLLLAHLPTPDQDYWLSRPLTALTGKSITDPKRLKNEFVRIRRLGWAQDKGETAPSIYAYAAPVFDKNQRVVAAISIPFLAGTEPSRMEEIRLAAIAAANAMSEALPE